MKLRKMLVSLCSVTALSSVAVIQSCSSWPMYDVNFFKSNSAISWWYDIGKYGNLNDENNFMDFINDSYKYVEGMHEVITSTSELPQTKLFLATLIKNFYFDPESIKIFFDADRYQSDSKGNWKLTEQAVNVFLEYFIIDNTLKINDFFNNYSIYLDSEILSKSQSEIKKYIIEDLDAKFEENFGVPVFTPEQIYDQGFVVINQENKMPAFDYFNKFPNNTEGEYIVYNFYKPWINNTNGINVRFTSFTNSWFEKIKLSELAKIHIQNLNFEYNKDIGYSELRALNSGDLAKINDRLLWETDKFQYNIGNFLGLLYKNEVLEENLINTDEELQYSIENEDIILINIIPSERMFFKFPLENDLVIELNFIDNSII